MIKRALLIGTLTFAASVGASNLPSIDPDSHQNHVIDDLALPSQFSFQFPDIDLVNHRNQPVNLQSLFAEDQNVVFAFFFTHCVSVCETITANLQALQLEMPHDTVIAMISIDPDTDTPDRLRSYVDQRRINDSNWQLLTGDKNSIIELQKEFEAYRGNKMNHSTSLFVKKAHSQIREFKSNFTQITAYLNAE